MQSLDMELALAAIEDDEFYRMTLEHNEREKAYLERALQQRELTCLPTSTNFIMIGVGRNGRKLVERLLDKGVIVRAPSHRLVTDYIRLTIGTRKQNDRFLTALDEVISL